MTESAKEMEGASLAVMRQSMRCFWFGLVGLVPVAGLGLASQALKLASAIGREMGEARSAKVSLALWGALLGVAPLLMVSVNWPVALVAGIGIAVLDAALDFNRLRASMPRRWNPARGYAWAGAVLARSGLGFSALLLVALASLLFESLLLGAR